MITIVGKWETGWLDPTVELFMFRQLKGAYKYDRLVMVPIMESVERSNAVEQYSTMEEALESCRGKRIFLEVTGDTLLNDIPVEDDMVFIFGNATTHNLKYAANDLKVRIPTPGESDMFAINAAAITLNKIYERR